jgi:hypothetical protein
VKYKVGKVLIVFKDFDSDIEVSQITEIHYQNLRGEEAETSRILNGLIEIKAEAEDEYERAKIETKRVEALVKRDLRIESVKNGGFLKVRTVKIKATEDAIKESCRLDKRFRDAINAEFKAKKDLDIVLPLYWKVKAKLDLIYYILNGGSRNYYKQNDEDY